MPHLLLALLSNSSLLAALGNFPRVQKKSGALAKKFSPRNFFFATPPKLTLFSHYFEFSAVAFYFCVFFFGDIIFNFHFLAPTLLTGNNFLFSLFLSLQVNIQFSWGWLGDEITHRSGALGEEISWVNRTNQRVEVGALERHNCR